MDPFNYRFLLSLLDQAHEKENTLEETLTFLRAMQIIIENEIATLKVVRK